ncbi:asialoglycoprotein receptor 2, isoform CRA_b [Rattus norvegicus]|uniref:Asialoglycoprotein receptor 2, isoform CRA_b n=1 Tax=Rattus norvegicus TaxID=10116 RepID=A6HG23_RAT|nr:asialoglycoprotein receptor 2, isoform CRA_b [Rattus norvegicus]
MRNKALMCRILGQKIHVGEASPPSRPFPQRLCSKFRLSLLALAFNILLLVVICVVSSQSMQLQKEFWTLKETLSNFSTTTLMEFKALDSHGGSRNDNLTSWETILEKKQKDIKADHSTLLFHLKHFPLDLRTLTCQLAFFLSNGRVGTGNLSFSVAVSSSRIPVPSVLLFLQAQNAAPLTGWSLVEAATGFLGMGSPGLRLTSTAKWRMPICWSSTPGRSRNSL